MKRFRCTFLIIINNKTMLKSTFSSFNYYSWLVVCSEADENTDEKRLVENHSRQIHIKLPIIVRVETDWNSRISFSPRTKFYLHFLSARELIPYFPIH